MNGPKAALGAGGIVQLSMDAGDQGEASRRLGQRLLGLFVGYRRPLQVEERRDDREVVGDAVLQLLEERFALLGEGSALRPLGIELIERQANDVDDRNRGDGDGEEGNDGRRENPTES